MSKRAWPRRSTYAFILLGLSLAAKSVFSAVEEALDVRAVFHDDEHGNSQSKNHLPKVHAFEVVFWAYETKNGQRSQKNAPKNATDRHVFCGNRKDNPKSESRKHRKRQNCEEHAKSRKHTLTASETRKASKAVANNHEQPSDERHPSTIVGPTRCNLSFAHFLSDKWPKEALQEVYKDNRQRRFPAQHAERIRKPRILGAIVSDIEIFTFRDFCDPDGTGDRPQQLRYWKAQ